LLVVDGSNLTDLTVLLSHRMVQCTVWCGHVYCFNSVTTVQSWVSYEVAY